MPRLAPHLLPSKEKKVGHKKNVQVEDFSEINSSTSSFRLSKEIRAKVDSWRTRPIKPRIKNDMLKEVNNILTMGEINKNLNSSKRYLRTVRKALSKSIEPTRPASEEDIKGDSEDDLSQSKVRNLMSFWNGKITHRPITVSYDYSVKNPSKKYRPLSKDGVQEEHTLKPSQIKEIHVDSTKKSTSYETIKKNPIHESIDGIRKKIMNRVSSKNLITFEKFSEIESLSNKNKWMTEYLKNIYEVRKFKSLDPTRIFLVEIFKQKYLESMKYPYIYFISNISENVETSYLKSIEPFENLEEESDEYKMSVETISYITGIGTDFLIRLLEIMDRGERTPENLCSISRSDLDKLCQIKNDLPLEKNNVLNYVESVEDLFLNMGDTCKKRFFDVILRFVIEIVLKMKDEIFFRKKTSILMTSSFIVCIILFISVKII